MLPKIKTILYTTTLGPDAPYVFRYALALARQHQAQIVAVHAMEPLSGSGSSNSAPKSATVQRPAKMRSVLYMW